jgi:hypothetical protein
MHLTRKNYIRVEYKNYTYGWRGLVVSLHAESWVVRSNPQGCEIQTVVVVKNLQTTFLSKNLVPGLVKVASRQLLQHLVQLSPRRELQDEVNPKKLQIGHRCYHDVMIFYVHGYVQNNKLRLPWHHIHIGNKRSQVQISKKVCFQGKQCLHTLNLTVLLLIEEGYH